MTGKKINIDINTKKHFFMYKGIIVKPLGDILQEPKQ
jgi:hypothetical protein